MRSVLPKQNSGGDPPPRGRVDACGVREGAAPAPRIIVPDDDDEEGREGSLGEGEYSFESEVTKRLKQLKRLKRQLPFKAAEMPMESGNLRRQGSTSTSAPRKPHRVCVT